MSDIDYESHSLNGHGFSGRLPMNRRRFLRVGMAGGGLTLGIGGLMSHWRNRARAAVTSRLLEDALPALSSKSHGQLRTLPSWAGDEIKRHFHGTCLNVEGFVTHICTPSFGERLGRCRSPEDREACFTEAFCSRVATEVSMLLWVETIAASVGAELDVAWAGYCTELSRKWNIRIGDYGIPLGVSELTDRLEGLVHTELDQAIRLASSGDQAPAIGNTVAKIGESAVRLLPLVRLGKVGLVVGVPVFFLLAARHVWDYAAAHLEQRSGDYQAAISGRLALLGHRLGAEFEREVRCRVMDLHVWQRLAVCQTADRLSEERVGFI
jgi:hypothetical protein